MPTDPAAERVQAFAATVSALFAELDWTRLGELACWEGGMGFYDEEQVAELLDTGLRFASDLGALLRAPGSSLYVGASVAELGPLLFEHLVLGREVDARNLPGPEADELNRVLAEVERRENVPLPRIEDRPLASGPACYDHLWLVSVLTDPEAFPALHDELYERHGSDLATGRGHLAQERERAEALVTLAVSRLRRPCLITTTDEELALVAPACERAGYRLWVPAPSRITALVGDRVRLCPVT